MNIACNVVATVVLLISAPFTIALHLLWFARDELSAVFMLIYDVWSE